MPPAFPASLLLSPVLPCPNAQRESGVKPVHLEDRLCEFSSTKALTKLVNKPSDGGKPRPLRPPLLVALLPGSEQDKLSKGWVRPLGQMEVGQAAEAGPLRLALALLQRG